MKKLSFIQRCHERHWVGDGFPVRTLFTYAHLADEMSPFLLLDFAGPETFPATKNRRGVGAHPHRGFETVTIVYDGEVEHRDSAGGGGKIGPGDVQWMTAGSGLVHEEFHGGDYAKKGGPFEMVQLWVNLPKKHKMTKPAYQALLNADIPQVDLGHGGIARVIAGELQGKRGPARTFSPVDVWDVRVKAGQSADLPSIPGHTSALMVLKGEARLTSGEKLGSAEMAVFDREGSGIGFEALTDVTVLVLGGQPLNEPVIGHGPFVMNTLDEIRQAHADYEKGRMGYIPE